MNIDPKSGLKGVFEQAERERKAHSDGYRGIPRGPIYNIGEFFAHKFGKELGQSGNNTNESDVHYGSRKTKTSSSDFDRNKKNNFAAKFSFISNAIFAGTIMYLIQGHSEVPTKRTDTNFSNFIGEENTIYPPQTYCVNNQNGTNLRLAPITSTDNVVAVLKFNKTVYKNDALIKTGWQHVTTEEGLSGYIEIDHLKSTVTGRCPS